MFKALWDRSEAPQTPKHIQQVRWRAQEEVPEVQQVPDRDKPTRVKKCRENNQ